MLKVRIIAAVLAILLTIGTIYVVPIILYHYSNFMSDLTKDQKIWFSVFQMGIGVIIGIGGFWKWKKAQNKKSQE